MNVALLSPQRLCKPTRSVARALTHQRAFASNSHSLRLPLIGTPQTSTSRVCLARKTPIDGFGFGPRLGALGSRGFANAKPIDIESKPPPKAALAKRILPAVVHENIYTLPNILTFSRLAAAPVVGYLILHDQLHYALGLFVYAGITDFVDGYLARRWNQRTVVGSVVDPMADKLLMTISTVTLTIQGSMPLYLAVIILGRDIGLAISAIYYRYISLPPPKTFTRYWDFSLPSAEVRPTEISKWNTFFQIALIGWTVAMPALRGWGAGLEVEAALVGFQYFTAATTVWSGASYLYTKDAVRILGQDEAKEKEVEKKDEHEIK